MNARLVSPRFPYIPLRLEIGGVVVTIEALLDTGFDGDILAPSDVLQSVAPEGEYPWTLADRSTVFAPYAFGVVQLPGVGSYDAMVTFLGDEYLVGLGIVRQLLIALDHGQRVIVEP